MADNTEKTNIYLPKTMNDFLFYKSEHPDILLMAGGTYLLSQPDYYPCSNTREILSTDNVPDFYKILHTDRFVEIGSSVTVEQLLKSGSYILSKNTFEALENVGTSVVRARASVGGALCIKNERFSICGILATLHSQVEIRTITKVSSYKRKISSNQMWLPISKIFSSQGEYLYANSNVVMTKIRIPAKDEAVQIFRHSKDSANQSESSVFLGFEFVPAQNSLSQPNFCLCFMKNGFFVSNEFNSILSSFSLPSDKGTTNEITKILSSHLSDKCPNLTEIQKFRAIRLFEHLLQELNEHFLSLF